jgi:hypothetical protein
MKQMCPLTLMIVLAAFATAALSGGDRPPRPERDPEEAFRKACERFVGLEAKHDVLKGAARIKSEVERGGKGRLKFAQFVFAHNAVPPEKAPARAKDDSQPFFYFSVQAWSGRSQQPPPDLHEFHWKGETYQLWVRVFGSDDRLVKAVRKTVDEPLRGPFAPGK